MVGRTLSHYRIEALLGRGGMGEVWRARDLRLERDVALKVLPAGTLTDDSARRRLRNEALAASRVSHPHVGTIHDFDSEGDLDFLVMEFVPGETLDRRVADGPLPESEVLAIGADLADALEAMHEQGVFHCDLKPANVMCTPRDGAKLLDFGLARMRQRGAEAERDTTVSARSPNELAGTLPYMAPEQVDGRPLDARTDLYALGAVLYEAATGHRPHEQRDLAPLLYAVVHTPVAPARAHRPALSPAFEAVLMRALDKDPARRFTAAPELRRALEDVARGIAPVPLPAPVTTGRVESLAVLPLADLSGGTGEDFFTDGMTEALITQLSRLRALRVISRTSAMQYRGVSRPVSAIARELGVQAVIEGSVLRVGNRVRIAVQLVEAASDRMLWSGSYERALDDVLALQSEVAVAIADEIRVQLAPGERERLAGTRAVSTAAYDAYLRGRHFWNKRTPEGLRRGIEYFQAAIEADPAYAAAWSGLADCWNILGAFRWGRPSETFTRAKAAATRAVELDPGLAEGHASLGFARMYFDWDWAAAGRSFERAIELHPGYATAVQWDAERHSALGQHEQAIAEAERARDLDPLSPIVCTTVGDVLYYARRFGEAERAYQRTLEIEPTFLWARMNLARTWQEQGRAAEAIPALRSALADAGLDPETSAVMAYAHAAAGDAAAARAILARLEAPGSIVSAYSIANVYVALGERDRAFEWLERALAERDRMMVTIGVHPRLDSLRGDPRFARLLRAVGLGG